MVSTMCCIRMRLGRRWLLLFLGLTATISQAFLLCAPARTCPSAGSSTSLLRTTQSKNENTAKTQNGVEFRTYSYQDWTVNYRYKPAAPGHERDPPLLLIHPVGIGLSSWFWENFMDAWDDGGPIYAPDLLGCGTQVWDSNDLSSSFPDRWVEACEVVLSLTTTTTTTSKNAKKSLKLPWLRQKDSPPWIVVTQGGLAPIGVRMTHRNPSHISHLILTSPPTWSDMTTAVPVIELERNDRFLRSPVLGSLAFGLLETRWAVSFFSNLFLFASQDDHQERDTTKWLDRVIAGVGKGQRYSVMAFNAGYCQQVSYETELTQLRQPTLILQGNEDALRNRDQYVQHMKNCQVQTIPGKNVLPWESPASVCRAIQEFI